MIESNPYNILKMEFPGLKAVISNYTSRGTIINYLNILEKALLEDNIPQVLLEDNIPQVIYALGKIRDWYDDKIDDIRDNQFVHNEDEHFQELVFVEDMCRKLADYDFSEIKKTQKESMIKSNKVFIVHGHDNEAKNILARTLEHLGVEAIILHEQADEGKTIIEKLETYTSEAAYAIILYTECDIGRARTLDESNNKYRARQNVVFEHGLFIGTLGRENVCALVRGDVETPGDVNGVVHIKMDDAGAWKIQLCKNMRSAGLHIDMNQL